MVDVVGDSDADEVAAVGNDHVVLCELQEHLVGLGDGESEGSALVADGEGCFAVAVPLVGEAIDVDGCVASLSFRLVNRTPKNGFLLVFLDFQLGGPRGGALEVERLGILSRIERHSLGK